MDLQYGVAVTNKYALFFDEELDPLEILRQKEEEAKNAKTDKKKSKAAKKPASAATPESKPSKAQEQTKREEKTAYVRQERGGFRGGRGRELRENEGGARPPRRQGPREYRDGFKGDENVPPEFRDRGGDNFSRDNFVRRERGDRGDRGEPRGEGGFDRGRGRGRGGRGRGRGGPRPESGRGGREGGDRYGGPPAERRREFDRHSGNDRTEGDTSTSPADVSGEWPQSAPAEQTSETAAELNDSGEAPSSPKEEEPKEMTLDEWKALQKVQRTKASFNIRKAGEGVDNTQWKKGIAYKKKQDDEDEESDEEEEEDEERHGHRKQLVTDIRITFADNPRRGGRGGRGGRGRGGERGGPRGGRGGGGEGRGGYGGDRADRPPRGAPRESAPRMDDETDFPRLVKSEA